MQERITPAATGRTSKSAGIKLLAIITGVVVLACAYGTYFLIKDGAPGWSVPLVWGMGILCGILAARGLMPDADEKLFATLAESGRARMATARIVRLQRLESMDTGMRKTRVRLTIMLPLDEGGQREATLNSFYIEDALLPGFSTGQVVHVLYDPARPEQVALDRTRSPVTVQ